jgi:ribosomal protein S5
MVADAPQAPSRAKPVEENDEAKPPSYYMDFEIPADVDDFTREFMNSELEDEDLEYDAMWKKFFFDEDEEIVEEVDDEQDGIKRLRPPERRKKDQYQENVVQVSRVNKTVKGGNQLSFRAVVVIGDGKGAVGVGVGKAKEVMNAVLKAGVDARRHVIRVPLNKQKSIPHRMEGRYGAAKVLLRPAPLGTGVIAGGSVRTVLEMAGVENSFGKQLGSNNPLNNARATLVAIGNMFDRKEVADFRKVPLESLRI